MAAPRRDERSGGAHAVTRIRIRHGLDVTVRGAPQTVIEEGAAVTRLALCGADYIGLRPRVLVQAGDHVRAGQPLFVDKRDPAIRFTSPGTGTVAAVDRGARRALERVVIRLDAEDRPAAPFGNGAARSIESQARVDIVTQLAESGLWTALRTRPFSRVPLTGSSPAAIFVTAIDTQPLAADPRIVIREAAGAFRSGLRVLARLTEGTVWLCTAAGWDLEAPNLPNLRRAEFSGPHPAGLAGTHVHCLAPVRDGVEVWHIGCQDVISIGRLFTEGVLDSSRVVALGGEPFRRPRLVRTRLGADLSELTAGELDDGGSCRVASGSLLSGRHEPVEKAFLGRFHVQVSAVREGKPRRFGGLWSRRLDTPGAAIANQRSTSGMLPLDLFERLLPPGFLAVPLLRALMAGDVQQAHALGCLELDEEDLALCGFACPAGCDYGGALRQALTGIERDG